MSDFYRRSSIGGLCFTRKTGERITINNGEIVVEVVQIKGSYVRLAFKGAREINVVRTEVLGGSQGSKAAALSKKTSND
jgi:carbon storage regulator CsrA